MKTTQLTAEQKLLLLNWMKTKPSFCTLITKYGEEKILAYYLKDKSEKRLQFILLSLRMRTNNKYKSYKPKKRFFRSQLKYPTGIIYARSAT